ncbi:MAG: MFS transporter [Cyclobacteriaceae bacterium]
MRKSLTIFALILSGETVFLLPFVIPRIFRPTFLKTFEITNFELGAAFSLYGVIAMVSYFAGGPLADRFSARKLMTIALAVTSVGGISMAFIPSLFVLTILYGFWGLTTILLYWAAFVKATREIGSDKTQGRIFGLVDGGRGLVAALLASLSVLLFDALLPVHADLATIEDLSKALGIIILIFSGLTLLTAFLIWFSIPENASTTVDYASRLSLKGVREVVKKPSIWMQSIILLCAYVGYKSTDDFSLYASKAFGYNDVDAAHMGTISFWMRPIAAFGAGIIGDWLRLSKMVGICFLVMILGGTVISFGLLAPGMPLMIALTIASISAGIYGLRGLYYALLQESKIPLTLTGSAVGIVSVIGYSPDIFMGPLMGYVLDSSPGETGHQHLFAIVAGFGVIGLITSLLFRRSY